MPKYVGDMVKEEQNTGKYYGGADLTIENLFKVYYNQYLHRDDIGPFPWVDEDA